MIFAIFLFSAQFAFSQANLPTLLFGYLRNDLTLQKYTLTAQSKALRKRNQPHSFDWHGQGSIIFGRNEIHFHAERKP